MEQSVPHARAELVGHYFPNGIPELWCPLLTHYSPEGSIDRERTHAHMKWLRPYVRALLAPGSTGDGWEMEVSEQHTLISMLCEEAEKQSYWLMIGVLRTERGAARGAIEEILSTLGIQATGEIANRLRSRRICGFTVTPPRGAELTQTEIARELSDILDLGVPTALYQLPQITENEMSPQTVRALAARYPNFYLLKDTSGSDRIALSSQDLGNVFLVRGAEGDYARWHHAADGPYHGFLLSTANSFARELSQVLNFLHKGRKDDAIALSQRISAVVTAVFQQAATLPFGNAFSNANRALDHQRAYGSAAQNVPLPRTHSGETLPSDLVEFAEEQLKLHGFAMERGYLT